MFDRECQRSVCHIHSQTMGLQRRICILIRMLPHMTVSKNRWTAEMANLAHHTAVAVAQQQVCALHVEVHNALRMQVLHALLHNIVCVVCCKPGNAMAITHTKDTQGVTSGAHRVRRTLAASKEIITRGSMPCTKSARRDSALRSDPPLMNSVTMAGGRTVPGAPCMLLLGRSESSPESSPEPEPSRVSTSGRTMP